MKPFQLTNDMKTMTGVFYPTGWMVLMFPGEQAARDAARRLEDDGFEGDALMLLTPGEVLRNIAGATGDDGVAPSVGSEGDTARRFAELGRQGHYALMVHAPHAADSDRAKDLLKDAPISYGQKYRKLVIEDVVE
ncbi:RNA-binding protein [Ramlibacter sp. G-1-2-2]|uniref:RNA-binding protein n=1 Tax=Ramlibacter agri TaxID=2728837 RepID=A0A848H5U4_9BURK|nr:RNA-binding protein [Ramlibacter agri]NML45877.1 RNA-binding protein [Ramlibacter agri]